MRHTNFLVIAALLGLGAACSGADPVEPPVPTTVSITVPTVGIWEGVSAPLTARVLDQRGDVVPGAPIVWSSHDTTIAVVGGGQITGRRPGSVTIEARSRGISATTAVQVQPDVVARIALAATGDSAVIGRTLPIGARFTGARGGQLADRRAAWTSDDTVVATVDADGVVRAVALGTTVVRAAIDTASAAMTVRVVPVPVGSVQLTLADAVVEMGGQTTVTALAIADDGSPLPDREVVLRMSDRRYATLDGMVVRAVGSGTVQVEATAGGRHAAVPLQITRPSGLAPWGAEIVLGSNVPEVVRVLVQGAVDRWAQALLEPAPVPLTPVTLPAGACGSAQTAPVVNEVVPRLRIFVKFDSLDGSGGAFAAAGPCVVQRAPQDREGQQRPVVGTLHVDPMDFDLANHGTEIWHSILMHEIGHILGIGTLWHSDHFVTDRRGEDPRFTAPEGLHRWRLLSGQGVGVPIETSGAAGTVGAHWRERVLQSEVMTGWVGSGLQPLSIITLGALMDFGWRVDFGGADPYTLPAGTAARLGPAGSADAAPTIPLRERILMPRYEVSGGVTRPIAPH